MLHTLIHVKFFLPIGFLIFFLTFSPAWSSEKNSTNVLSPAEFEQLRALGYVGGTHEEAAPRQGTIKFDPNRHADQPVILFNLKSRPVTDLLSTIKETNIIQIAGRNRSALSIMPGKTVSFQGTIEANSALTLGVGLAYAQIRPNALLVQIDIFDSVMNPLQQEIVSPVPGMWVDRTIDLKSFAGREIRLVFSFLSLDPNLDQTPFYLAPVLMTRSIKEKNRPNVFFVLVDTLRADALGCYGQKDSVTPNLDQLAREGILCEKMIAQSPHTETSIPSILQGLYPHIHGRMFRYSRHNSSNPEYIGSSSLNPDAKTIAEIFQQAGYLTYGLYNNVLLSSRFGFLRGFYEYIDYAVSSGMSDAWGRIALPTAHIGIRETIDRLERVPKNVPLFVFLHILDPHNPYTPPNEYNLRIKREAAHIDEAAYLSETAYMDDQIGKLVRALKQQNLYQDSILLITGDHGEEFVNSFGRPIGHGRTLFQTMLHVPFICVYPAKIPPGKRIQPIVESVDIYPTLLELAGLSLEQTLSGKSFAALFSTTGKPYEKSEAIAEGIRRGEERKCLIKDGYKLVYFRDSERTMLYDLRNDPGELNDIAAGNPSLVKSLKERLLERFQLTEPFTYPLQVINLGQDGWDIIHTFTHDSSYWQPGISDIHLQVKPIPETIDHVEIWADDHLHGNHNFNHGWRWPPLGEQPLALDKRNNELNLFFDLTENLLGSKIFIRIEDKNKHVYLGSFDGQNVWGQPQPVQTKDTMIEQLDFENEGALNSWTAGKNGKLSLLTKGTKTTDTFLQFETDAPSGSYRVFHLISNLLSDQRILISFQLVIESGGVKIELIHPKTAQSIGSHTFTLQDSGNRITIPSNRIAICGVTGMTRKESDLLFLVSNFSPNGERTKVFFNDITVSIYPKDLENPALTPSEASFIDQEM